eukprot:TRINITY_DN11931_c0_g3_i2.p1 TRINITY_DN11931_c0_g3~~TRINITY_DN11931_c0_g3_i2.p1  ORF type:complete len:327 (+),score=22.89 TRINITY_DN11931_c0_g3_i2:117-1097(+)
MDQKSVGQIVHPEGALANRSPIFYGKRLFEMWPGRNVFYCGGRFMTGPYRDMPMTLYTHFTIHVISIAYLVFATPLLVSEGNGFIVVFNLILYLSTAINLFLTAFTDPGIIPRKNIMLQILDSYETDDSVAQRHREEENTDANLRVDEHLRVALGNNQSADHERRCYTCDIIRPPRSSHCSDCDNCVQVFDHHCPFVNNCIGKRNYRFFMGFIFSLFLLILSLIIGFSLIAANILNEKSKDKQDSEQTSQTFVIILYVFLGLVALSLFGFVLFHCYLSLRGVTTKEMIKRAQSQMHMQNYQKNDWCSNSPSLFDPRQQIRYQSLKL